MSGTWWTRLGIIAFVVMWAFWSLIPTVFGESAADRLMAQRNAARGDESTEEAPVLDEDGEVTEEELPWYDIFVPKSRINLGLDLQGGIDMTLHVGVDEATMSSVQRDVKPIRDAAEEAGLKLVDVRRATGEPTLLMQAAPGVGLNDINGFM